MTGRVRGLYGASALLAVAGVVLLVIGFLAALRDAPAPGADAAEAMDGYDGLTVADDEAESTQAPVVDVAGPVSAVPRPPVIEVVPTRVRIPSIEVDANVVDLGLKEDRSLEVPEDISVTGWYTGRSVPGEIGPSVVVGHVDSAVAGKGVFSRLPQLGSGDAIEIERSDGSVASFRVTAVETVSKAEFPTDAVYGSTAQPTLRLITCGGDFDRSVRSYEHNVIVYAEFLGNREPPVSKS